VITSWTVRQVQSVGPARALLDGSGSGGAAGLATANANTSPIATDGDEKETSGMFGNGVAMVTPLRAGRVATAKTANANNFVV
jgi:hypothetical protein